MKSIGLTSPEATWIYETIKASIELYPNCIRYGEAAPIGGCDCDVCFNVAELRKIKKLIQEKAR